MEPWASCGAVVVWSGSNSTELSHEGPIFFFFAQGSRVKQLFFQRGEQAIAWTMGEGSVAESLISAGFGGWFFVEWKRTCFVILGFPLFFGGEARISATPCALLSGMPSPTVRLGALNGNPDE